MAGARALCQRAGASRSIYVSRPYSPKLGPALVPMLPSVAVALSAKMCSTGGKEGVVGDKKAPLTSRVSWEVRGPIAVTYLERNQSSVLPGASQFVRQSELVARD